MVLIGSGAAAACPCAGAALWAPTPGIALTSTQTVETITNLPRIPPPQALKCTAEDAANGFTAAPLCCDGDVEDWR
jgi:hypothetical protein